MTGPGETIGHPLPYVHELFHSESKLKYEFDNLYNITKSKPGKMKNYSRKMP
jgi:hypothetical protein